MSELGIETVGQLAATPLPRLEAAFGEKEAQWLYGLARGVTGAHAGWWVARVASTASPTCWLVRLAAPSVAALWLPDSPRLHPTGGRNRFGI